MIKTALLLSFLLLPALSSVFAQGTPAAAPPRSVVFIAKTSFCYEGGIKSLAASYLALERSAGEIYCYPVDWREISQLEKELADQKLTDTERQQKEIRLKNIILQRKEYPRSETYRKKERETVGPILTEIENALAKIASDNNLLILDPGKLFDDGLLLVLDFKTDLTKQFIGYFNDRAKKSDKPFKLEALRSKIGVVRVTQFFDKQNGLNVFVRSGDNSITPETACKKTKICAVIGNAIQVFALKNGFTVVFDSSKELPPELDGYPIEDITAAFIEEYNKNKF